MTSPSPYQFIQGDGVYWLFNPVTAPLLVWGHPDLKQMGKGRDWLVFQRKEDSSTIVLCRRGSECSTGRKNRCSSQISYWNLERHKRKKCFQLFTWIFSINPVSRWNTLQMLALKVVIINMETCLWYNDKEQSIEYRSYVDRGHSYIGKVWKGSLKWK